jgi:hypothetical protein
MASSYSNVLGLELIGPGEQSGTWGVTTNTNLGTLLEQAITGVETITMSAGDSTLVASQGIVNQARNAVIVIGGTPGAGRAIIIPQKEKVYIFTNTTSDAVLVTTYTRTFPALPTQYISVPAGASLVTYCNGTDVTAVNPFSASPITVTVFTGYISATQLTVSAVSQGSIAIGQTLYVPSGTSGFTAATTITAGTTSPYTVSVSQTVGSATNLVTFVALATPNQIATVDYVQNKSKSVYLGGIPTTDTATSTIGQAFITGTTLVVTAAPVNGFAVNQFVYGKGIAANTQITALGSGITDSAQFTGFISGFNLTVNTVTTPTIAIGQYITGSGIAFGTRITGGSGVNWTVDTSQTVGSATNLITINGWGAGVTGTGYYTIGGASQTVPATTVVTALQQFQIANTSLIAGIVNGLGTIASQSSNSVSISGGTISGVSLTGSTVNGAVLGSNAQGTKTISTAAPFNSSTFLGYISGTTMIVPSVSAGAIVAGQTLTGSGITPGTTVSSLSSNNTSSFTGSISGTTLTVAASPTPTGTIAIGQTITGIGITLGTVITGGSALSWTVSASQTVPVGTTITGSSATWVVNTSQTAGSVTALITTNGYADLTVGVNGDVWYRYS